MRALESGKLEAERCEPCNGTGWLLEDKPSFRHINRAHLAADVVARAVACTYSDHDDECMAVPSKETHTEASPCPVCKPDWVPPSQRAEQKPPETKERRREREQVASDTDKKRWWD